MLTNDGSPLTRELAKSLIQQGMQVVVVSFPQLLTSKVSLPPEINHIVIEDDLIQQLNAIADRFGSIAALIHLQPQFLDREREHKMLERVFFLAKQLKISLNKAAQKGDSCWLTVAHLDGELGTTGDGFDAITGGLFGLTKALRWEWSSVFCRAIDLGKDFDVSTSIKHIIAELHDPNRLIAEVGYSDSRTTLVC